MKIHPGFQRSSTLWGHCSIPPNHIELGIEHRVQGTMCYPGLSGYHTQGHPSCGFGTLQGLRLLHYHESIKVIHSSEAAPVRQMVLEA